MAKRRKLEAPSAEDLSRIEAELDTDGKRVSAPIAQVAADSAGAFDPRPPEIRVADAKDRADAERLRSAEADGRVMLEIPLDDIQDDALVRDRAVLIKPELDELAWSIARNGLRLPVEVFVTPDGPCPYGILSGYRRMKALRYLRDDMGFEKFATVKAVIRDPEKMGGSFAAMVEENEIRSGLSHFERGRIAVIAMQQEAFLNVEAAVDGLFPQASKAKRSKIRSFAAIFEELGDLFEFPDKIRERDGLKMAAVLREGRYSELREILADRTCETAEEEAALIAEALARVEAPEADPARGGRPKKLRVARSVDLDTGITLQLAEDGQGWLIRLKGRRVDRTLAQTAMRELQRMLGPK